MHIVLGCAKAGHHGGDGCTDTHGNGKRCPSHIRRASIYLMHGVRTIRVEQVWTSGLPQTYSHLGEEEQRQWAAVFDKEATNAADPDKGDLCAPRLMHHWRSRPGKSEFFVACDGMAIASQATS